MINVGVWLFVLKCLAPQDIPEEASRHIFKLRLIPLYSLKTRFSVSQGGSIWLATDDYDPGGPSPRNKLIMLRNGSAIVISDLNRLKGAVAVRSETDALNFVRLRTSPMTYGWDGSLAAESVKYEVELTSAKRLRVESYYGLTDRYGYDLERCESSDLWISKVGLLPDSVLMLLGVPAASVSQEKSKFVVRRIVLAVDKRGVHPTVLTETVGRDGSYSAVRKPWKVSLVFGKMGRPPGPHFRNELNDKPDSSNNPRKLDYPRSSR